MNNLPEIRDIHIPDGVSILPLATGWWVVLSGIVLCFIIFQLLLWGLRTSRKYYALKTLKAIDTVNPVLATIEISQLLKRVCAFKYKNALALYGKDWINFLNTHSHKPISEKSAELLMFAPFMDKHNSTYLATDAEDIKHFAKTWIGANL